MTRPGARRALCGRFGSTRTDSGRAAPQLRAYLDYHKIPYKVVEVNPLTKKEIKWSAYTKARQPPPWWPPELLGEKLSAFPRRLRTPRPPRCLCWSWTASS